MGRMIPERVVQNRVVQGLMMRGKFYDIEPNCPGASCSEPNWPLGRNV